MNNKRRIKTAATGVMGSLNKPGRHKRKWLDKDWCKMDTYCTFRAEQNCAKKVREQQWTAMGFN